MSLVIFNCNTHAIKMLEKNNKTNNHKIWYKVHSNGKCHPHRDEIYHSPSAFTYVISRKHTLCLCCALNNGLCLSSLPPEKSWLQVDCMSHTCLKVNHSVPCSSSVNNNRVQSISKHISSAAELAVFKPADNTDQAVLGHLRGRDIRSYERQHPLYPAQWLEWLHPSTPRFWCDF